VKLRVWELQVEKKSCGKFDEEEEIIVLPKDVVNCELEE
jgi:hypothetical protein